MPKYPALECLEQNEPIVERRVYVRVLYNSHIPHLLNDIVDFYKKEYPLVYKKIEEGGLRWQTLRQAVKAANIFKEFTDHEIIFTQRPITDESSEITLSVNVNDVSNLPNSLKPHEVTEQ